MLGCLPGLMVEKKNYGSVKVADTELPSFMKYCSGFVSLSPGTQQLQNNSFSWYQADELRSLKIECFTTQMFWN